MSHNMLSQKRIVDAWLYYKILITKRIVLFFAANWVPKVFELSQQKKCFLCWFILIITKEMFLQFW